ncbi:MAG: acyl-CoA thioesterase/BAAT N-terminal domain-containing protein [Actinocatenispora sp.]
MSRFARFAGVLVVLAAALVACGQDRHPVLTVVGSDLPFDEPLHLRAAGLGPGDRVTIGASLTDEQHHRWQSRATYVADGRGRLDLDRDRPRTGKFRDADSMGLFWTLAPSDQDAPFTLPAASRVTLTVVEDGTTLVRRTVVRRTSAPGIRRTALTVQRDGIDGVYFQPAQAARPRPALLIFGGSEGGLGSTLLARMLATHGYPTLRIAYFGEPGLPRELREVPVEYGGRAVRYLSRQPGVDPHRVVVMGASRGSELAELLGVHYPDLVHGVVALTPANVAGAGSKGVGSAWTWHGRPVPYTRQFNQSAPTDNPDAVIPVERTAGPVLATCGGMDQVWVSCDYATAIMRRLDAHHHGYPDRMLRYPDAGHYSNGVLPYDPLPWDPQAEADQKARVSEYHALRNWLSALPAGSD